jgi:ribosomal protein S12 methylthiotransferase accessory factor
MGKGRTAAQARTGALCEAVERQSAAFQGDEPRLRARWDEFNGDAIHPDELQNFSEAQFRTREETNARVRDPRRAIPLPFDPQVPIDWTPAWSLTHERHRYLPTTYCYLSVPVLPEERFCGFNPNGHAAGNCVEEAILQAFFELVERDAIAIWWYGRIRRPAVEWKSFGVPYFEALVEHYRSMGWRSWVLDLTHDLGIPTFVALARATDTGRFCVGFGCHFDAKLALSRALTELNQLFDPSCRGPAPWDASAIEEPSFLFPDDATPSRQRGDYPVVWNEDLRDDVRECVKRAERAGLEVLVLDQTRPDMGLSAVKVIIPGLRHFWPRLGPGRLYEVPVRLKWVQRPLLESELNPVHIFL